MAAHRYWRIYNTAANAGMQFVAVADLQWLDGGGTNLVGSGTPSSSGDFNGSFPASGAFDGSTTLGLWICTNGAPVGSWLQYDFGTAVSPVTVKIGPGPSFTAQLPIEFIAQFSDNATTWTDVGTFTTTTPVANVYQSFALSLPSPGDLEVAAQSAFAVMTPDAINVAAQSAFAAMTQKTIDIAAQSAYAVFILPPPPPPLRRRQYYVQ